jgi:hypothetical protein
MARNQKNEKKKNNGANVGYEAELWQMADAPPGSRATCATPRPSLPRRG